VARHLKTLKAAHRRRHEGPMVVYSEGTRSALLAAAAAKRRLQEPAKVRHL